MQSGSARWFLQVFAILRPLFLCLCLPKYFWNIEVDLGIPHLLFSAFVYLIFEVYMFLWKLYSSIVDKKNWVESLFLLTVP